MARETSGRIALISIKPWFADAILQGEKRVEFRKAPLGADVAYAVIYATKPMGQIVGFFEVTNMVIESPAGLWRRFHQVAGISKKDFFAYYDGRSRAVGIEVGRVERFAKPFDIGCLGRKVTPPQSYCYLPAEAFGAVARLGTRAGPRREKQNRR